MKETKPLMFPEANNELTSRQKEIEPLPCYTVECPERGRLTISCWKIPFWQRFKVLMTGRVWLCVRGETHPPVYITTDAFEQNTRKEELCQIR